MSDLFYDFIEHTSRNVFLTGKAGTGKTTFLNHFVKATQKKCIVAAPTGIAAINAGGVTLHSLFGLPLLTYLPTTDATDNNIAINTNQLISQLFFSKEKLNLLRSVEILIIDEASMLRSDTLDSIDIALKKARQNTQTFGGVQMLLIGDLYQLPPVVRHDAKLLLSKFYLSNFFFQAKAMLQASLVTLELKKVFRQNDENFLTILNNVRYAKIDKINFDALNSRYQPNFQQADNDFYIYLTTHNALVDNINQQRLQNIKQAIFEYKATIENDFRESLYPTETTLRFKIGAQVMFIRNDPAPNNKKYYNGKLATIVALDADTISVQLQDSNQTMEVLLETWENKKYTTDANNKIHIEVIGKFIQYPIRLAWAITVHKSQGLTFDKAIIDLGNTFESGQVYVALSRCRTLEGIILKTKITPSIITVAQDAIAFEQKTNIENEVHAILEQEKYKHGVQKIIQLINFMPWLNLLQNWALQEENESTRTFVCILRDKVEALLEIANTFSATLHKNLIDVQNKQLEWNFIEERISKCINYFLKQLCENVYPIFLNFYEQKIKQKIKKNEAKIITQNIDVLITTIHQLGTCTLLGNAVNKNEDYKKIQMPKFYNEEKLSTHEISFLLFNEGKDVFDIAAERQMNTATIYGHLYKMVILKKLTIEKFIPQEKIEIFVANLQKFNSINSTLTECKTYLGNGFDFDIVRILMKHFGVYKNPNKEK